jgi:FkbM family methyltransferase
MADAPNALVAETGLVTRFKDLLRPYLASVPRWPATLSWQRSFRVLRRYGLRPRTVFDIGVAYGTYELYRAFPDSHYHLFDPTRESLRYMQLLKRQLSCDIHRVALGDCDGEVDIKIRSDIQAATLLEDLGEADILRHDRVPMRRFDSMIGEIQRPSLCKIDVQGAELQVLEGMTGKLDSIDAFVIETSTIATLKGGPEFHEIVQFMHEHGFVVTDVVGMVRRPLDDAMAQLDLLFLPAGSPIRHDRRWAAA